MKPPSLLLPLLLAACASTPAPPATAPRSIAIALHADAKLNTDAKGRALALVTRIFTLRHPAAFERAGYEVFLSPEREKEVFGTDLVSVKEVMLIPGQRYSTLEKVGREAGYVGVVALFHSPAPQRWRLTFAASDAERTGIAVSAHACALSAAAASDAAIPKAKPRPAAPCQ